MPVLSTVLCGVAKTSASNWNAVLTGNVVNRPLPPDGNFTIEVLQRFCFLPIWKFFCIRFRIGSGSLRTSRPTVWETPRIATRQQDTRTQFSLWLAAGWKWWDASVGTAAGTLAETFFFLSSQMYHTLDMFNLSRTVYWRKKNSLVFETLTVLYSFVLQASSCWGFAVFYVTLRVFIKVIARQQLFLKTEICWPCGKFQALLPSECCFVFITTPVVGRTGGGTIASCSYTVAAWHKLRAWLHCCQGNKPTYPLNSRLCRFCR